MSIYAFYPIISVLRTLRDGQSFPRGASHGTFSLTSSEVASRPCCYLHLSRCWWWLSFCVVSRDCLIVLLFSGSLQSEGITLAAICIYALIHLYFIMYNISNPFNVYAIENIYFPPYFAVADITIFIFKN